MRLKCVMNVDWKSDIVNGRLNQTEMEDRRITLGKEYECTLITTVGGQTRLGSGAISTSIGFLVYDDNKNWSLIEPHKFAPLEAE